MGDFSVVHSGERGTGVVRPDFNRSIKLDFQGATLTSDTAFFLLREVDERFNILSSIGDKLENPRAPSHTKHSLVQVIRQQIYQIAAGYEDCNDADDLRIDPALRLAMGKNHDLAASQAMLSRFVNDVLGNERG